VLPSTGRVPSDRGFEWKEGAWRTGMVFVKIAHFRPISGRTRVPGRRLVPATALGAGPPDAVQN